MIGCCEGEVRDCCLKSYWSIGLCISVICGGIIFQNSDANCSGVKGERCSVDASPAGHVMATHIRDRFLDVGGMKLCYLQIYNTGRKRIPHRWCGNRESSGPGFNFHPRDVKRVTTG